MSLTMSSLSGGTVNLPSPRLGNTNTVNGRIQYKRAYDGTRYSYLSTPADIKKTLIFSEMSSTVADSLIAFLHASADEDVTIVWGLVTWIGRMLLSDFVDTTTNRRNGHSIPVEFTTNI